MRRVDARGPHALILAFTLALLPGLAAAAPPPGASALDAFAFLRDAEARGYRLDDDAVRTLAVRVESPAIDELLAPGAPLAGRDVRITLWWKDGEGRVRIEGAEGADEGLVESLEALVSPLPALLLPERPSRGLVGSSFSFVTGEPLLRPGDRGVAATARDDSSGVRRVVFAISREGLIVGERMERVDGRTSEFRHHWILQGGRYLLGSTEGWLTNRRVSAELTWGALVGERPVPTSVIVLQGDLVAPWPESARGIELLLSEHRINAPPPPGLFP